MKYKEPKKDKEVIIDIEKARAWTSDNRAIDLRFAIFKDTIYIRSISIANMVEDFDTKLPTLRDWQDLKIKVSNVEKQSVKKCRRIK